MEGGLGTNAGVGVVEPLPEARREDRVLRWHRAGGPGGRQPNRPLGILQCHQQQVGEVRVVDRG